MSATMKVKLFFETNGYQHILINRRSKIPEVGVVVDYHYFGGASNYIIIIIIIIEPKTFPNKVCSDAKI